MPLYDYHCDYCGNDFEDVMPVSRCDESVACPVCAMPSKKCISLGHGGIQRKGDSLPWVREAAMVLHDTPDAPGPNPNINTVDDLRRFYDAHPNIRPKESHPALPSSYGDGLDAKPDKKKIRRERVKRGLELIRRKREITINTSAGRA